jgi:hypothetical protein
MVDQSPN